MSTTIQSVLNLAQMKGEQLLSTTNIICELKFMSFKISTIEIYVEK